jgi:hypothetical protein
MQNFKIIHMTISSHCNKSSIFQVKIRHISLLMNSYYNPYTSIWDVYLYDLILNTNYVGAWIAPMNRYQH